MLKGLGESEMIKKIIREEVSKYTEDDLQNWRIKNNWMKPKETDFVFYFL